MNTRWGFALGLALSLAAATTGQGAGSGRIKLNAPLAPLTEREPLGSWVEHFAVSPDEKWLVYEEMSYVQDDFDDFHESQLVSVSLSDYTTHTLGVSARGSGIPQFSLAMGCIVVPQVGVLSSAVHLRKAPIEGGALTEIPPTSGDVDAFLMTADGLRVVYTCGDRETGVYDLYSIKLDGSGYKKLNAPLPGGYSVANILLLTPNQSRVVFEVGPIEPSGEHWKTRPTQLWTAPVAGGAATRLTPPFVTGGDVGEFGVTSNSLTLVYRADQDTYWMRELYCVPLAGGTPRKLNRPIPSGGYVNGVFAMAISPRGDRVAYVGPQDTPNLIEAYSVALAGGDPVKLNPPLVPGVQVSNGAPKISPDGSRILFGTSYVDGRGPVGAYTVPSEGGTPVAFDDPAPPMGVFTPDSATVVYAQGFYPPYRISRVPSVGGAPIEVEDNGSYPYSLSPDGRYVYNHREVDVGRTPLFGGAAQVLTDPIPTWKDGSHDKVGDYWVSADGKRIIYIAAHDAPVYELYSKPLPVPPLLDSVADAGGAKVGMTWTEDSPTSPAQYLSFAYDAYKGQWVSGGWEGSMWFPFAFPALSGEMDVAQSGAYHTWISNQWTDGTWLPCLDPKTLIVYSGAPHTPTGLSVESSADLLIGNSPTGLGSTGRETGATLTGATNDGATQTWRLHWNPEIYGTWLAQIAIYQDGVGWIAPLDGPCAAFPQFSPWTFLDYGGLVYDSSKGSFLDGWADFTLPAGGPFTFFLNFKAWDASTEGPFAMASTS